MAFRFGAAVLATCALSLTPMRPAAAKVIICSFTEPFIRTFYDPEKRTLTLVYDAENKRREVLSRIGSRTVSPKVIELRNEKQDLIQRLELNNQGSDGMSDKTYPYEGRWTPGNPDLPEELWGGCR